MTRAAVLLAALGLLVVACSGPDPADGEPTPDPTPSPTTTTPPEPVMPAAAQEQTAEGAAAFVKYWYRLQAHAATTGDTSGLTRASLKNCDPCSLLVDRLNEIYAAGGYYESFPWRPQIVGAKPERKYFVVLTEVSTDSYKFRESSSEPVITVKPKTRHHLFRLRFGTNGWRMLLIANQTRPSA